VLGLEAQALAEAQAERIDRGERHAAHGVLDSAEHGADLTRAEDDGQQARAQWTPRGRCAAH
jgi:hypothetical protein